MNAASKKRVRYGLEWGPEYDDLRIELKMIQRGGGTLGLFEHFMRARALAWPDRYRHEWTDLIYSAILRNIVTILMGPGSSQKTSHGAEFCLLDYWSSPENTIVLISTLTEKKLDLAVFAEVNMLFNDARRRFPWLAGNPLSSRRAIATDTHDTFDARDIRKGIVGLPCYVGKNYVGLGVFAGIKQARIRFLADELQFMMATFFDCLPNMFQSADLDVNGDPDVKVIGSGNPKHDPQDQLSKAAEPRDGGWPSVANISKTTVWPLKFYRGECVNLIGLDSPNFKVSENEKPPYRRLISRQSVKLVATRWGTNSMQYYTQCVGKMQMGMIGNRVLTKLICETHRAFERAIWADNDITKIGFLDPAWGGINADDCIFGWLEFGTLLEGIEAIRFGATEVVPIDPEMKGPGGLKVDPDDQIAHFVKKRSVALGIPPENIFYGSTGRGTTGAAFARVFGTSVPVPIAEGDKPSPRPVRHDLYVIEEDGNKRLKRCDEEYGRLNAELWFSVRNVVECDQMRELSEEVVTEFELREFMTGARSARIELEKKEDTRERMGRSPDRADALSFGVEGARQRGFIIKRQGWKIIENEPDDEFFDQEAKEYKEAIEGALLNHGTL